MNGNIRQTTDKIKELKAALEQDIFLLIERFENNTGTVVTGLGMQRTDVTEFGSEGIPVLSQVAVDVMIAPIFRRNQQ